MNIYLQLAAHSLKPIRVKNLPEPCVLLTTNNWDDFGFRTTFDAWYLADSRSTRIGEVKIAVADTKESATAIDQSHPVSPETFIFRIERSFLSLGQSRKYYEQIVALIGDKAQREELLAQLNDAVLLEYRFPNRPDLELRKADAFSTSLLRDTAAVSAYGEAKLILFGDEVAPSRFNFNVTTALKNRKEPISLNFDFDRGSSIFATNVAVVVGKNGLGKTQTLYAIQRLLCEPSPPPPPETPLLPPFRTVVVVAYSPFERFPTTSLQANGSRPNYVYCGFRDSDGIWKPDLAAKSIGQAFTEMTLAEMTAEKGDRPRLAMFSRALKDGLGAADIKIKDYRGSVEAVDFVSWGLGNPQQMQQWLKSEPIQTEHLVFNGVPYQDMSAGQKMFVLIAANICAVIQPGSLLLVDEPELYLHPNLECTYIRMIKTILQLFEANAIVATHSVFVVREVPSRCVTVLKETDSGEVVATLAQINTFGGDLNLIADYVFDNVASAKSYEEELDKIAKDLPSFAQVREQYGTRLGFEALAYLRQKMETRPADGHSESPFIS